MSFWRDNGLTIVLLGATALTVAGMFVAGWQAYDEELTKHGAAGLSATQYLMSGNFLSALFENWESEFLQMAAYVCLTAFLFQRGSAESKDPDEPEETDEDIAKARANAQAPALLRAGPVVQTLYAYSLGIALGILFFASFLLHLNYSWEAANAEARLHGEAAIGYWTHLMDSQFWFESFQNWQSEFLSTALLVVLSIFLRFRGSPESKPVAAPHSETGA